MIKAKSPDTARIAYRGSIYKIYDAYPTRGGASSAAIVVDLGKDAGRLRYGVFISRRGGKG